ncbi:hypothetical protein TNCV_282911 [Trichonephila clavipes]|nr:hypothetical protein TNCV_282911 [Trichonephila clavipes]
MLRNTLKTGRKKLNPMRKEFVAQKIHFAIGRLFYEENREMFLVPGKRSLYGKIRNIEVRNMEEREVGRDGMLRRDVANLTKLNTAAIYVAGGARARALRSTFSAR